MQITPTSTLSAAGSTTEARALAARVRARTSANSSTDTFLSHSHKDHEFLPGVISILEAHGGRVYVDDLDTSLPNVTSPATAAILKKRIAQHKKFVAFVTNHTKDSRWVPWELGLADGLRTHRNTAVFPATTSPASASWAEVEYYGLYDKIVRGRISGLLGERWIVWNQFLNNAVTLESWLSRVV